MVAGDGEGVAGMIVKKAQNLHISTAGAVGSGEPIVGEVGLPHLVGLLGGETDVGRLGFFFGSAVINPARLKIRQMVASETVS